MVLLQGISNTTNKEKGAWIITAGLIAIAATYGLNLTLGEIVIDSDSVLHRIIADFSHAFSADMRTAAIEALFIWGILVQIDFRNLDKRFLKWWIPFSVLIAICIIFADELQKNNSLNMMFSGLRAITRAFFVISSHSLLIFIILYAAHEVYRKYCGEINDKTLKASELKQSKKALSWWIFVVILMAWMPYYIVFFPGNTFQDTVTQLMQAFHLPSMTAGITLTDGINTVYSDHHPVFLTILYGAFARIGIALSGNIKLGIGIYSFCQMVFMAFILSSSVRLSGKMGQTLTRQKLLVIVYAICPFFALNSVGVVKDINLAVSVLIVTELLLYAVYEKGRVFSDWRYSVVLSASLLLMILCKKTGIYIVAFTMICFCFHYRKRIIATMLPFVISILIYSVAFSSLLFPMMNVQSSGKQEMMGFIFQQTARYVHDYPEDVSDREREVIDEILDYDNLAQLYNPKTSDPVKATFHKTADMQDIKEYLKVYAAQFLRHPDAYFQALFSNISIFFYLDGLNMQGYTSWMNISDCRKDFLENYGVFEEDYRYLEVNKAEWQTKFAIVYSDLIGVIERLPLVGLLFRKAGIIYLCMTSFFLMMYRKNKLILGFIPVVVCFMLIFVSPVGDMRYIYPLVMTLPLMCVHSCLDFK